MGNATSKAIPKRRVVDDDPSLPIHRKVAIVGIGCRYANGIDDAQKFWKMLVDGMDCTSPPPDDRFDTSYFLYPGGPEKKHPGKMYNQRGGYLKYDVYSFDREFFKIPPDEAAYMDPQVRLLLEVVFEAFEDASLPMSGIRGSNTGVYIGLTASEYQSLATHPPGNVSQYTNSGVNTCMASNRISFEFDLRGPSYTIDTACSSSLYAIHQACEAIRNGDCQMAVAGGANLLLLPATSIGFCQAGMLSPDGRCKSFDAKADGYSRSEGAGVVILKPLAKAVEDGDQIYAVVRGGALSNDGRTPGIANPSYEAQVDLVERAYKHAKVDPYDVQYVEAHGTGTQVGDTTEANALGEGMGRGRPEGKKPLYIGSVKSNFGHTEGAAGVAGVIKVALCLKNRKIPKVVHFKEGNSKIGFKQNGIQVPEKLIPWPTVSKMVAGCSSFGFGGANAHLVLEDYSNLDDISQNQDQTVKLEEIGQTNMGLLPTILVISASTKEGLKKRMSGWIEYLEHDIGASFIEFANAAYTSALKTQHHNHRVAIIGRTKEDAIKELRKRLEEKPTDNLVEGVARDPSQSHIVFVFSGMGTQWWGMARQLMNNISSFRETIKKIDKILRKCGAKWSLVKLLTYEGDRNFINQTEIAQPSICAVQIALVELWRLCGVNPHAIVGHSVGEVAAAYTAGLLPLEDAIRVIYNRGRQLRHTSGSGTMLAVIHPIQDVNDELEKNPVKYMLDIAAINSPSQMVFSGDTSVIQDFSSDLKSAGIKSVILKVNNAFHSRQQEVIKNGFLKKVRFLSESAKKAQQQSGLSIPMLSTVTNEFVTKKDVFDPNYWYKNIRQQVKFMAAINILLEDGYTSFLEIGPNPALKPAINDIFSASKSRHSKPFTTHSLKRPRDINTLSDDLIDLMQSFGKLYVEGCQVDLESLFTMGQYKKCPVPSYPWQRVRCSCESEESKILYTFPMQCHALLGEAQDVADIVDSSLSVWKSEISHVTIPWVKDHVVQDNVIVPAAAYVETALAACRELNKSETLFKLRNVSFERFLFAPSSSLATSTVKTSVVKDDGDNATFTLQSKESSKNAWALHSSMEMLLGENANHLTNVKIFKDFPVNIENWKQSSDVVLSRDDFYIIAAKSGFNLGSSFRCNAKVYLNINSGGGLFFSEMSGEVQQESGRYIFHPAYLDSIFQAYAVQKYSIDKRNHEDANITFTPTFGVPRSIREITLRGRPPRNMVFFMTMKKAEDAFYSDVTIADAKSMEIFCEMKDFKFADIKSSSDEEVLWHSEWQKVTTISANGKYTQEMISVQNAKQRKYLLVGADDVFSSYLKSYLEENGNINRFAPVQSSIDSLEGEVKEMCLSCDPTDVIITAALSLEQDRECLINWKSFENAQFLSGIICQSIYKVLKSIHENHYPNLWLISRGERAVTAQEETNPEMTGVTAVGLTILHENPEFPVYMIDLPLHTDGQIIASTVFHFLQNPLVYENHIVLRQNLEDKGSFDIYSPRVISQAKADFAGTISTQSWVLVDNRDKSCQFKQQIGDSKDCLCEGQVMVEVMSCMPILSQGEAIYKQESFVFAFAGRVKDVSLPFNTRKQGDLVVGVTKDNLPSTLLIDEDLLCNIPTSISASGALAATVHLLAPFVTLTDIGNVNDGLRMLVYLCDIDDGEAEATVILARSLGIHVTTISLDSKGEETRSTSDYNSEGEQSSPMFELDDGYDVIMFSNYTETMRNQLPHLCTHLRPMGRVVFLNNGMVSDKTRLALPILTNVVVTNSNAVMAHFASSHFFQQKTEQLLQCLSTSSSNINQFLEKISQKVCISEISAQRNIRDNGLIITVDREELFVPVDFGDNYFHMNENASYIVTGGTKGLGSEIVEWLVKCGARYVITFSRSSAHEPKIQEQFSKLRSHGAFIMMMKVDVSSYDQVERALRKIKLDDNIPPVKGIFHSAVVYADTLLPEMTSEIWNNVMSVKAYGALVLHKLTVKMEFPIKYFVLLSSIVALIGNAGQANYCSANTYLASLAQLRRSLNLPATVLYGGVINSTGFAARRGYVEIWEEKGLKSVSPAQLLRVLGTMLRVDCPALGLTSTFSKDKYYTKNKRMMLSHEGIEDCRFSSFKALYPKQEMSLYSKANALENDILSEEPTKALAIIDNYLCNSLKKLLGISSDIELGSSPFTLGIDSQRSSMFGTLIEERFDVTIPPVDILNDKLTITSLGESIYQKMVSKRRNHSIPEMLKVERKGSPLLAVAGPTIDAKSQLICYPPNSAGQTLYKDWHDPFNKRGVQTIVIQLPGWEGREKEKPFSQLRDIVSLVAEELKQILIPGRFSFYGHSMGGLIAFEVTHYLVEKYDICPVHLFVGGCFAPSLPYPYPNDFNVPNSVLRTTANVPNTLKEYGAEFKFLEKSVLNNKAVMARILPSIEAGLAIYKTYQRRQAMPLPCPLTVFAGKKDEYVKPNMVDGWKSEITSRHQFKKVLVPGRHLFLATCPEMLVQEILDSLIDSPHRNREDILLTSKSNRQIPAHK
ncbi:mycocerosic acid synthase-like isoform X1 [Ptychodera flava]|uniref:mycocerosic acid synthase-like isoform X1 n=1 Tax=Ptychodera flava TaxID=63121 RepID=UPI003969C0D2